jgi:predicted methyltransferase
MSHLTGVAFLLPGAPARAKGLYEKDSSSYPQRLGRWGLVYTGCTVKELWRTRGDFTRIFWEIKKGAGITPP